MKKTSNLVKKIPLLIVGIIIGITLNIVYASTVASSSVTYSNSSSGISATNVQGAVDELYTQSKSPRISKLSNVVAAYIYNSTSCKTGNETACVRTTCTKKGSKCDTGTIVDYKVNDSTIVRFHVISDDGTNLTMQSQKNTIYNIPWQTSGSNTSGPTTILLALETATIGWTNVQSKTYTLGTTVLYGNKYTGCSAYNSCTANKYTLSSRTARARMITVLEANNLKCSTTGSNCPAWMYSYLYNTGDNSTTNGSTYNEGYWMMQAYSSDTTSAWRMNFAGKVTNYSITQIRNGARAVVVVTKTS